MSTASQHKPEIARGFAKAWRCLLGSEASRNAFARRLRKIRSKNRRWIYQATATYDAIRKASIQPAVLRSRLERNLLIHRYCARDSMTSAVVNAETEAIRQLDVPYFFRQTAERMPPDSDAARNEALKALERALFSLRKK